MSEPIKLGRPNRYRGGHGQGTPLVDTSPWAEYRVRLNRLAVKAKYETKKLRLKAAEKLLMELTS